ncbi:hypothetical protein SK803_01050 [Lentzea sp. BCCO 10_0856]|uniref:DUF6879 domain-containing protein n=1 Tax=Lentzea miocenica TaxID=3095431 RepID=A0ABU4SS83_9PSEU|nr:DUF6879 family protein [Lentzea sp. BCCO 10_0856]MDX8028772.1 hypothetical protein [Lentzea sp. BCCO 10_0856]
MFPYPSVEFDELFRSFEHTAFRLEVRERYNAPDEQDELARFLAGDLVEDEWEGWWLPNVRKATAEGRRFERVRVVNIPPSDYTRYSLWSSRQTVGAGEDIRYLVRNKADEVGLPNHDYWLFDSRKLVRMHFDDTNDRLISVEVIDDDHAQIVQHNYWRDAAWHHAVRREDFAAEHDIRGV